jgi:magnesium-transporting ATPase (P-type)
MKQKSRRKKAGFLTKHPAIKIILSALAVAVFGFILLNIAFLADFLFQTVIDRIIRLFTPADINMGWAWFPLVKHLVFVLVIGLLSLAVFRSELRVLYKAIYMTVPLAAVFATIGIVFYRWPAVAYSLGALFTAVLLYHLYRKKQPWLYYYTLLLVAAAMLLAGILGVEI